VIAKRLAPDNALPYNEQRVGILVGIMVALAAGALLAVVRLLARGFPRWPTPRARHYCMHPDCNASFLAQSALALHDRASHAETYGEIALWPHPLPPRCLDIVWRRRRPPALRVVRSGARYRVQ
jgi:hypothetical protein